MLEESSFANKKADYFWLLLLSSVMLLVCYEASLYSYQLTEVLAGTFTTRQPSLSFFFPRFCANLLLVKTSSINTNIIVWSFHHKRSISSSCARRFLLGVKWNMESGYS
jgi:hypothetical protein